MKDFEVVSTIILETRCGQPLRGFLIHSVNMYRACLDRLTGTIVFGLCLYALSSCDGGGFRRQVVLCFLMEGTNLVLRLAIRSRLDWSGHLSRSQAG